MPSHGSLVPLLKFQTALNLRLLLSSGFKKKEPKYYILSKSLKSEPTPTPPPGSPLGPLLREMPVSRAIFYTSLGFPNKQGLLIKSHLSLKFPAQVANSPWFPQRGHYGERHLCPEPSLAYPSESPVKEPSLQVPLLELS